MKYHYFCLISALLLTSCIKDEPQNSECDILSAWVEGDAYEECFYQPETDMRTFQFGVAAGAEWQFAKHFGLFADLNWGLTGIFNNDFKTVEQTLYPIYGTIGVSYKIK